MLSKNEDVLFKEMFSCKEICTATLPQEITKRDNVTITNAICLHIKCNGFLTAIDFYETEIKSIQKTEHGIVIFQNSDKYLILSE